MKCFFPFALAVALAASPVAADPLESAVKADLPGLLTIYRDLHEHPELSFQEKRSAAILAAEAKKLGFAVTTGVGQTGVVAVMRNGPGPVLLLRADMDALPIAEQTGLPFASKARAFTREGAETAVMHACGHDTHMTAWIGTARGHAGDDRPARRGTRPRREGDDRRRALHPLSQARRGDRLP